MLIAVRVHKVLHPGRLDLHYVANVKVEDPFILIEEAQYSSHINLLVLLSFV